MRTRLLRTAFFTALVTYLCFGLLEYTMPGYVSFVFSPHLAAACTAVLGVLWAATSGTSTTTQKRWSVLTIVVSIMLGAIVWQEGKIFGDFRLPLALAGLLLPWWSHQLLSQNKIEE